MRLGDRKLEAVRRGLVALTMCGPRSHWRRELREQDIRGALADVEREQQRRADRKRSKSFDSPVSPCDADCDGAHAGDCHT